MNKYLAQIYAARAKQLALVVEQQKFLDKLLLKAHQDISRILDDYADDDGIIKRARLKALQREIEDFYFEEINSMQVYLVRNMTQSINREVDGRIRAGMVYMYDISPRFSEQIPKLFVTIPDLALRAVLSRRYDDGLLFSERIWKLGQFGATKIMDTVAEGVLKGWSASDLSKALEKILRGKVIEGIDYEQLAPFSPSYKYATAIRGDIRYNAMRLARTELAHAYSEASIQCAKIAPWVLGLKWNLSASHPKPDICDKWATDDLYGLGKGVYKPDRVPVDHPNGLCFLTDVLVPKDQLLSKLEV